MDSKNAINIIKKVIKTICKYGIPQYVNKMDIPKLLSNIPRDFRQENSPTKNIPYKKLYEYLSKIIKSYHGHSFITFKSLQKDLIFENIKVNEERPLPNFKWDEPNKIGTITYYHFYMSEDDRENTRDEKKIVKLVKDTINKWTKQNMEGLIIDLRNHNGGNMHPTINSLSDILNKTTLFGWSDKPIKQNEKKWFYFDGVQATYGNKFMTNELRNNMPISIIVSKNTLSSGEFIASIFCGRKNTILIGDRTNKTGGFLSGNNNFVINDDIYMTLTVSLVTTVDGIFHDKEYLNVDVNTSAPITYAKKWIKKYNS